MDTENIIVSDNQELVDTKNPVRSIYSPLK